MSNVLEALSKQTVAVTAPNNAVKNKTNRKAVRAASIAGSLVGIGCAVAGIYAMKKNGNPMVTFKNLKYEEADVIMISAGSVLGGLTGGLISDKNSDNKVNKYREALQQFGNTLFPVSLLAFNNKMIDKYGFKLPKIKSASKTMMALNSALPVISKAAVTVGSLVCGMEIGNKIMNTLNNKIFKEEVKHDVHPEDYLVHADDLCLAATMIFKDINSISNITAKVLPLTFLLSGTKSGIQEENKVNQ